MRVSSPAHRSGPVARMLVLMLRFYRRWISPILPPTCRFHPTCSAYALDALTTHGALYGSWLTVRRLLRCAPWHPGGVDPVPPPRSPRSPVVCSPVARSPGARSDAESESSC